MTRSLPLAAVFVLLAACGGPDTARRVSARSTVPATEGLDVARPHVPQDPAFAAAALRTVDPCALLDEDALTPLGTPAVSRLRDYGTCTNHMTDADGRDLGITLTVGDPLVLTKQPDESVAGLPAAVSELDDETACFAAAVTETEPPRGIVVQADGGARGELCEQARRLLENVVNRVRELAPRHELARSNLAEYDPCLLIDPADALGEDVPGRPAGLHACRWTAGETTLEVAFRLAPRPEKQVEGTDAVEIGDIEARLREERARCRIQWSHVDYPPDAAKAEVVEVVLSTADPGLDACAVTRSAAAALVPELPPR